MLRHSNSTRMRIRAAVDGAPVRAVHYGALLLMLALAAVSGNAHAISAYPSAAQGRVGGAPAFDLGPTHSAGIAQQVLQAMLTHALVAYQAGAYHEAAGVLRPLADQGDRVAQFLLGSLHDSGLLEERDAARAVYWYRKAALQGHVLASYNLGVACSRGDGVAKDMAAALEWWKRAAERGNRDAQFNLGVAFITGKGIARNPSEALHWWLKAAAQGDDAAQYNLGALYAHGDGVPRDFGEAQKWWSLSARQGNERAETALKLLDRLQVSEEIRR